MLQRLRSYLEWLQRWIILLEEIMEEIDIVIKIDDIVAGPKAGIDVAIEVKYTKLKTKFDVTTEVKDYKAKA